MMFSALNILDNILFGRSYIVEKYAPSVPSIHVNKNGTEQIGTAFLVRNHSPGKNHGQTFLVTARHNVDPDEKITFLKFNGLASYKALSPTWRFHPERDLAAMPVSTAPTITPIYSLGAAVILSRTISLGYPKISSTDQAYLLAHNGELNAIVTSYLDRKQYLIISNDVAPGSSGGPVLDDAGLCIGMVVRALEGKYEDGVSKANAAIPASDIQEFIASI